VLSVVAIAFVIIGVLCTTLSVQSLNLVNSLPKYCDNIYAKWAAIQKGPPGPLNLAFRNIGAVINDLGKVTALRPIKGSSFRSDKGISRLFA
jgi:predicted PurR-regulated permease PerM